MRRHASCQLRRTISLEVEAYVDGYSRGTIGCYRGDVGCSRGTQGAPGGRLCLSNDGGGVHRVPHANSVGFLRDGGASRRGSPALDRARCDSLHDERHGGRVDEHGGEWATAAPRRTHRRRRVHEPAHDRFKLPTPRTCLCSHKCARTSALGLGGVRLFLEWRRIESEGASTATRPAECVTQWPAYTPTTRLVRAQSGERSDCLSSSGARFAVA